jgi:Icc-related predicted phosphoesterase
LKTFGQQLYGVIPAPQPPQLFGRELHSDNGDYVDIVFTAVRPAQNVLERLSQMATFGLAAVAGNHDRFEARAWIRGEKQFDLEERSLRIGSFLLIGLAGEIEAKHHSQLEPSLGVGLPIETPSNTPIYRAQGDIFETEAYDEILFEEEASRLLRLAQRRMRARDKIVVVSHTPPKKALDGTWPGVMVNDSHDIGSSSLRNAVMKNNAICAVICGHVHHCGGNQMKLNDAIIVNVSSHNDPFARAHAAWITLATDGKAVAEIVTLPSLAESHLVKSVSMEVIQEVLGLRSKAAVASLIEVAQKNPKKLFENLESLSRIKNEYGVTWPMVLTAYELGVKMPEDLNEVIFQKLIAMARGIDRIHLQHAHTKWKRRTLTEKPYLISHPPAEILTGAIAFDTEYYHDSDEASTKAVLFGFMDLRTSQIKQFWGWQKREAIAYLKTLGDRALIHWSGEDRRLLEDELSWFRHDPINLCTFIRKALVAKVDGNSLHDIDDAICGKRPQKALAVGAIDGMSKATIAWSIGASRGHGSQTERTQLMTENKADLLALGRVIRLLPRLPIRKS